MNIAIIVFYVVIIGAMMYFMAIKPQKKEQKRQQELMDSMEIGDYVLTTSGFYGVLIDISEDDVIVEFGNNKNCRILKQGSGSDTFVWPGILFLLKMLRKCYIILN